MAEQETCPIEVSGHGGWRWHRCGKPVKRDGMCGVHAAAKERRERNAADRLAASHERRRQEEAKRDRQTELLAAEAAVERVRGLLDGAPMITQADVRRALDGETATTPADVRADDEEVTA